MNTNYNWKEIQKFYDDKHTWREVREKFKISNSTIAKAVKNFNLKLRSKKEAAILSVKIGKFNHKNISQKTKDKISNSMKNFLENNPDRVPYLINHSSKKSYPEQLFENALLKNNIEGWIYNYRNGIYQYDFAFPNIKLDIEIDGATHKTEKVIKIDKRRDEWSISKCWKVIRFEAIYIKNNLYNCVEKIKQFIGLLT